MRNLRLEQETLFEQHARTTQQYGELVQQMRDLNERMRQRRDELAILKARREAREQEKQE